MLFFVSATNIYGITLVALGTIAVILVVIMFVDTLKYIMQNSSSRVKAHSAFVLGVYPVNIPASIYDHNLHNYLSSVSVPVAINSEKTNDFPFYVSFYVIVCIHSVMAVRSLSASITGYITDLIGLFRGVAQCKQDGNNCITEI